MPAPSCLEHCLGKNFYGAGRNGKIFSKILDRQLNSQEYSAFQKSTYSLIYETNFVTNICHICIEQEKNG